MPTPGDPAAPRDDETSKAAWSNFRNRVATVRAAGEGNEGGVRRDFGFLPVPARCRFDERFKFSILLNCMLSLTSMLTVANIYCGFLFHLSYERVCLLLTCMHDCAQTLNR